MSADNWRDCPRCWREAQASVRQAIATAREAYGKVPLAKYEQLLAEANHPPDFQAETLREDYEFWMDDNGAQFHTRYKAGCDRCGFSHEFSHDESTSEAAADQSAMDRKATA